MTVYLVGDPAKGGRMDFDGFMAAYTQFFGTKEQPNLPARSTVQVAGLVAPGMLVEIEVQLANNHEGGRASPDARPPSFPESESERDRSVVVDPRAHASGKNEQVSQYSGQRAGSRRARACSTPNIPCKNPRVRARLGDVGRFVLRARSNAPRALGKVAKTRENHARRCRRGAENAELGAAQWRCALQRGALSNY